MIDKSAYVTHEGTKGEVIIICLKIQRITYFGGGGEYSHTYNK